MPAPPRWMRPCLAQSPKQTNASRGSVVWRVHQPADVGTSFARGNRQGGKHTSFPCTSAPMPRGMHSVRLRGGEISMRCGGWSRRLNRGPLEWVILRQPREHTYLMSGLALFQHRCWREKIVSQSLPAPFARGGVSQMYAPALVG